MIDVFETGARLLIEGLCTYSRPKFFEDAPAIGIEITSGTQFSVTHVAPPDLSLPAGSSIGGLCAPAPGVRVPSSWGRIRKPSQEQTRDGSSTSSC